jgi:hypothetical protein
VCMRLTNVGSQSEPDGTTVMCFGPRQPDGVAAGNCRGWCSLESGHR